eukprot:95647_1
MESCCNASYTSPLNEERKKNNKRSPWLKYMVGIQFVIIITLIVIYSKHDSISNDIAARDDAFYDEATNDDKRATLPSVFPYRNKYCSDPLGLVSELIGRWYSEHGVDTVFGVTTYYTEFLTFEPLTYGVINPSSLSNPNDNAEEIFGVRYFRQVIANGKNPSDHAFAPSTPIHEETGYYLFMFMFDDNGENPTFHRVLKSIAIPRGETVLAHASYKKDVIFDDEHNVVQYVLKSGDIQKDSDYQVVNGQFTSSNAAVPSFLQMVEIDLENHIFKYNQSTPIIFDGEITEHNNAAILTKLNI